MPISLVTIHVAQLFQWRCPPPLRHGTDYITSLRSPFCRFISTLNTEFRQNSAVSSFDVSSVPRSLSIPQSQKRGELSESRVSGRYIGIGD